MTCRAFVVTLIGMVAGCDNPAPGAGVDKPVTTHPLPEIVNAVEAIQAANIATTDPASMDTAETDKVLPRGPRCDFSFGMKSQPVFAVAPTAAGAAQGVVKIHGRLVRLQATRAPSIEAFSDGAILTAEGMRIEVVPQGDKRNTQTASDSGKSAPRQPADLLFDLEQGLHVGYRGWYRCGEDSR